MASTGPIRMCVSCRRRAPQASLIRLAVGNSGAVEVAQLRRRGRGAYVCPRRECLAAASGAFRRRLRTSAALPAPDQIAIIAATVVKSQLQRIARCPTASVQRERLTRLLTALQTPGRARLESR